MKMLQIVGLISCMLMLNQVASEPTSSYCAKNECKEPRGDSPNIHTISSQLIGSSKETPSRNCSFLKGKPSGMYWLDPDGSGATQPFKAYCEMETDGGGWTLAYTYTFTNYPKFNDGTNAVTPRPTWPVNFDIPANEMTLTSTLPPKDETSLGAIDYDIWKLIGNEWLIKSNIMNWISCVANNGSLVDPQDGHLSCKIVKELNKCKSVPDLIFWKNTGPSIFSGYYGPFYMYSWDHSTTINIPAHDPCGENMPNHLRNVANPIGNILIR